MFKSIASKYILFVLIVLSIVIRLISINQSLWMDEAISAFAAKNFGYSEIINNFIKSDTHPPLYYLILKFWTGIFGYSELALRTPSIIFGVVAIFVLYRIGKTFNDKVAWYTGILASFSPLLVYYSQEARMYSLTVLLVSLSFYFFINNSWTSFAVGLFLLGATDYLPLLILVPMWLIVLFNVGYRAKIKSFVLSHIPFVVFFAIWFPIFNIQQSSTLLFLNNNQWWGGVLGAANIKNIILVWVKFLIGRINFFPDYIYVLVVGLVSILALTALYKSFTKYKETYIYWLWLLLPIALSYVMSVKLPGFSYFRLIFTLPAFILLLAYGFAIAKKGKIFFILYLIGQVVFSGIYLLNNNFWREDWKTAVPFIESKLKVGEHIYVAYPESFTPYDWYSTKPGLVKSFNSNKPDGNALYTLDYLKDLTDPDGTYDTGLKMMGYENVQIYNFRGVGQVRYWVKM